MIKNGRSIKEDISIIKRGIKEFNKILPGLMILRTFRSVITALTPYIAVIMSARILNELVGKQNKTILLMYILISIGATLLLSCAGFCLDAKIAVGYSRLFSTHEIILTDKAYRIPFFLLENEDTRSLREQVSGSIDLTGGGMASLYWDMDVVVTNLCSGGIALVIGLRFMNQVVDGVRSGMISGSMAVGIMILSVVLIAGCSYFTCKIASKRFDVSFDVFEHGAAYNRYGEFYILNYLPDEDMAMDIRIFRQKKLILEESQKKCYQLLAKGKVREMRAVSRLDVAKAVCAGICGMAVYAMVGFLAIRGVIGIGNVIMIYSAVTMLIAAFSELAQIGTDLRNNNVHLLNFFKYMDMEERTGAEVSEPEKTRAEGAEPEKIGAEVFETQKIRAKGTETQKTRAEGTETQKTGAEGTETEKIRAEVFETQKIRAKGTETQKIRAEVTEPEKIGAEGTETQKSREEGTGTEKVKAEMIEAELPETEKSAGKVFKTASGNTQYEIVLEKVSFHYPGSEVMVLQDVNLRITSGEKLAIVGENGSGKTTLIKLICRFYRPTTGRILFNGEDIWDYPYDEYIREIATVFQDFSLFAFSIAENVAASREYNEERVYEALCRAGLQKKIDKLAKGIKQAISHDYEEDGMNLSGGEAQKTAIARAIYKAAPIVILDEPTAALDPYAEKEIYEQFFHNLAKETMLSISHRLSSCRFCDRIVVLCGGRLVQQGTHEELLGQTDGKYAELWEMQAQYYS